MKTKYNTITLFSILALLIALGMEAKNITIWNATNDTICIAFVKTAIKSKTDLITGKDRLKHYYHDINSEINAQYRQIAPGGEERLTAYERKLGTYDRTLWVMRTDQRGCEHLQNIDPIENNKLPQGAQAFEIGSKDRVVIVPTTSGKYALKTWTQKLGDEIKLLSQAFKVALEKSGQSWESFKESAGAQWKSMKISFNRAYAELKQKGSKTKKAIQQKATQARRKIFGKSQAEIAAEVEGEGVEGGGEIPGSPLVGAGLEGVPQHEAWENEGFPIDDELEPGSSRNPAQEPL